MPRELRIIGCGPGGADYVLPAAHEALAGVDAVAGAERLLTLFPNFPGRTILWKGCNTAELLARIEEEQGVVAVLVSGDPGLFSLSAAVLARFGRERCRVIPGISSVQVACARAGADWSQARIISAHAGAPLPDHTQLQGHDTIALLAGNPHSDPAVCALTNALHPTHQTILCRDLTLPEERIEYLEEELQPGQLGAGRVLLLLLRRPS